MLLVRGFPKFNWFRRAHLYQLCVYTGDSAGYYYLIDFLFADLSKFLL